MATMLLVQSPTTNGYCLDHTSPIWASGSGLYALESNKTLFMRPVIVCPRPPFFSVQVVNSPQGRDRMVYTVAVPSSLGDALGL